MIGISVFLFMFSMLKDRSYMKRYIYSQEIKYQSAHISPFFIGVLLNQEIKYQTAHILHSLYRYIDVPVSIIRVGKSCSNTLDTSWCVHSIN